MKTDEFVVCGLMIPKILLPSPREKATFGDYIGRHSRWVSCTVGPRASASLAHDATFYPWAPKRQQKVMSDRIQSREMFEDNSGWVS